MIFPFRPALSDSRLSPPGDQRDQPSVVLLVHGGASARLPADRLPALQAGAGVAGLQPCGYLAIAAVWHLAAPHAAHGGVLRRDDGGACGLLLLHLLAGPAGPVSARGQLLARHRSPGRFCQLRAGPGLRVMGGRQLRHAERHLAGLRVIRPAALAVPALAQALYVLQPHATAPAPPEGASGGGQGRAATNGYFHI